MLRTVIFRTSVTDADRITLFHLLRGQRHHIVPVLARYYRERLLSVQLQVASFFLLIIIITIIIFTAQQAISFRPIERYNNICVYTALLYIAY